MDVFEDYFGECSEQAIKENFVIVYEVFFLESFLFNQKNNRQFQLLDEMLDNGYPLATESNILKELIKPPNMLRKVTNMMTGDTKYEKKFY